ncbi:MAG: PG0541 family transporter-associated protein [Desulfosalsimonadaceae bacterium]
MKLFLTIYDVTYDDDVMETLNGCCVIGFTKWDRVQGKGPNSDPKMDTAVWPGYNSAVAVVAGDDNEEIVREALRAVAKRLHGSGIIIYELPVSEVAVS